jgi:hypothetical protein
MARALTRIQETIKECEENGRRTATHFEKWKRTVQKVRRAVVATESKLFFSSFMINLEFVTDHVPGATEIDIDEISTEMRALRDELMLQEVSVIHAAAEVRDAHQEYTRILMVHQEREEKLKGYTDRMFFTSLKQDDASNPLIRC